jgi:hypothetical protein
MSRIIHCNFCCAYLGEIKEARLHKDIRYICGNCGDKKKQKESGSFDFLKELLKVKK